MIIVLQFFFHIQFFESIKRLKKNNLKKKHENVPIQNITGES